MGTLALGAPFGAGGALRSQLLSPVAPTAAAVPTNRPIHPCSERRIVILGSSLSTAVASWLLLDGIE
jgi:hypothetical protein